MIHQEHIRKIIHIDMTRGVRQLISNECDK